MKHCNGCGLDKPSSSFHKASNTKDGLHTRCKACRCARRRGQHRESMDVPGWVEVLRRLLIAEIRRRGLEWCPDCKQAVAVSSMYAKSTGKQMSRCEGCNRRNARRTYHERIKNDPERYQAMREMNKRYFASALGQAALQRGALKRKGLLESAFVEPVDREYVWARDGGVCGICGEDAEPHDWHVDHIIPLSRGGEHSHANVQVAHPVCNLRKRNKLPEEMGLRCRSVA